MVNTSLPATVFVSAPQLASERLDGWSAERRRAQAAEQYQQGYRADAYTSYPRYRNYWE